MIEKINYVLSKSHGKKIIHTDYKIQKLHGGDVGDVQLITGIAETTNGEKFPYKLVLKIQKKWERYGDVSSWRREYDLYASDFSTVFSDLLSWPKCYHAEINGDVTQIWMEFIEGLSGNDLTIEMLEHTARELGRFQGKLFKENPASLSNISNLGKTDFMKNDYNQWDHQTVEYQYIRSLNCEIPQHLCQMLIDMDNEAETVFEKISNLPVVLCHRDLWLENIFYTNGKSYLIDWDTSGWGFMGEDIASLIVDETDSDYLVEYYGKLVPAYYKGISEYVDISLIDDDYIWEMILLKFGYRIVGYYMFAKSPEAKKEQINALQKIYEMQSI
ncbi:aminoglycoside phosphotransferase family protein [Alkalicella caledoniensis]|uniref:Aminoglycoside phosphotransferase family protein n=1 Tax=Alkalicella caledoniensis TaxID=2731377 RepID=A0A7G9W481_ALKCA|nr:aminoglycoside phosphotransferase family protein [Alkalicella caledoniensis]QNO13493.1 aminoglycoside phosphotransferase family protein [Alkalicella caledoniensis]